MSYDITPVIDAIRGLALSCGCRLVARNGVEYDRNPETD